MINVTLINLKVDWRLASCSIFCIHARLRMLHILILHDLLR